MRRIAAPCARGWLRVLLLRVDTVSADPGAARVLRLDPHRSIQPQFGDVARVLREFAALDPLDDLDQALVGACLKPDLLAFAHDITADPPRADDDDPLVHHIPPLYPRRDRS